MGKSIMLQGTMTNVGKSMLIAGMCRAFAQDGYRVAPFCAKGMVQQTHIMADGKEISKMQALQAQAAGVEPQSFMNPILFKPTQASQSRIIMNGEIVGNLPIAEYAKRIKEEKQVILDAYERLRNQYDIVIMEGAGSPVEMSPQEEDMANMGLAREVNAPVLMVGDMDRGGVLAQLLGTFDLLSKSERALVKGLVLNKFRGIRTSLQPMLQRAKQRMDCPVLGVVPYLYYSLEEEEIEKEYEAQEQGKVVDIVVVKLPHISNYVDFNPFECTDAAALRYASNPAQIGDPDMIVLPDTTNLYEDLLWMRQNGIETKILQNASRDKIIFGMGAGYQMLGEELREQKRDPLYGMHLLPIKTYKTDSWQEETIAGTFDSVSGIFSNLSGMPFTGCRAQTNLLQERFGGKELLRGEDMSFGTQKGNVYGVNIRGLFNQDNILQGVLHAIQKEKGYDCMQEEVLTLEQYRDKRYDQLADIIRQNFDMDQLYRTMDI